MIVVRDLGTSLRFYRDGLGLAVLLDREVEGDWPGLFDGPSRVLRAVFLGDPKMPDVTAGVLELLRRRRCPDWFVPVSSDDGVLHALVLG